MLRNVAGKLADVLGLLDRRLRVVADIPERPLVAGLEDQQRVRDHVVVLVDDIADVGWDEEQAVLVGGGVGAELLPGLGELQEDLAQEAGGRALRLRTPP